MKRTKSWAGVLIAVLSAVPTADATAQVCPGTTVISELRQPLGMELSNLGNLIVSETGARTSHSGRISILASEGVRRTLIDGLPSGLNDVNEPSGPAGIAMRGRTLYVLIGVGDSVLPAPIPTRHLANPNTTSPLFSSVLALHFSANVERTTSGFTLSQADQDALAAGERVILSNGGGDTIEIELVTNFPDHIPDPLPDNPQIVRASNPFGIVVVGNQLYVTDGGRNLVWAVDLANGTHAPLTAFGTIPNPLLPIGGPVIEAVPTGIAYSGGQLLVALFRGVPFAPGTSDVVLVDPSTGQQTQFIGDLKTAIGILPIKQPPDIDYLVLQNSSGPAPFFAGPGLLIRFESPNASPQVLADCLARPTSMVFDERTGTLYVSELLTGRVVAFQIGS